MPIPTPEPKHDVFLSHSTREKAVANAMCKTLERQGLVCWIAPRDILSGKDWSAEIKRGIERSRVFVLILSTDANESDDVYREVVQAGNAKIPIIAFFTENVEPSARLDYFIRGQQWFRAFPPPLDKHVRALVGHVRQLEVHETVSAPPVKPHRRSFPVALAALALLLIVVVCGIGTAVTMALLAAPTHPGPTPTGAHLAASDTFGWIGLSSAGCWGWVLPPAGKGEPVFLPETRFQPPLVPVRPEGKALALDPAASPKVREALAALFRRMTEEYKVPARNVVVVAEGCLTGEAGGPSDPSRGSLNALVDQAIKGKTMSFLSDKEQIEAKVNHLVPDTLPPEKQQDAVVIDVGSDMVRLGWVKLEWTTILGEKKWHREILTRAYPIQPQGQGWDQLERDLDKDNPFAVRKTVYLSRDFPAALAIPKNLLLGGKPATPVAEEAEAAWMRAWLDKQP